MYCLGAKLGNFRISVSRKYVSTGAYYKFQMIFKILIALLTCKIVTDHYIISIL